MIWVIGSKGMLGTELCNQLNTAGVQHVATDLEVDILDKTALDDFASKNDGICAIANCAAYTAVDKAEDEEEKAFAINADGVANIAQLAEQRQIRLVHISTDYVFRGDVDRSLTEDDPCGPISVYGRSKLEGEEQARAKCGELVIIRTAWLYGLHGKNFVYTMLKLMRERDVISVVDDQYGAPTNASDLAAAAVTVLRGKSFVPGIYHYTGKGRTTWYEFAGEIYSCAKLHGVLQKKCEIVPVSGSEYPTRAKRPNFSLLSSEKIERTYGCPAKEWRTSLEDFFTQLEKNEQQKDDT